MLRSAVSFVGDIAFLLRVGLSRYFILLCDFAWPAIFKELNGANFHTEIARKPILVRDFAQNADPSRAPSRHPSSYNV
jgi:hypothetical protein